MKHLERNGSRRKGSTLLELVVAAGILAMVLGVPFLLVRSSERLRSTTTSRSELQARARRVLDRIAERLESASQIQNVAIDRFDFQLATGWDGTAVIWSPLERLELVSAANDADDGVDNDRDGLVDEKDLVWTRDVGLASEQVTLLCDDVPESMIGEIPGNLSDDNGNGLDDEPGVSFEFLTERIVVRIGLVGRDMAGDRVEHVAERGIALRN